MDSDCDWQNFQDISSQSFLQAAASGNSVRAEEIGFDAIYLSSYSKIDAYRDLKTKFNLDDSQICYVGDDLPDIPLLGWSDPLPFTIRRQI